MTMPSFKLVLQKPEPAPACAAFERLDANDYKARNIRLLARNEFSINALLGIDDITCENGAVDWHIERKWTPVFRAESNEIAITSETWFSAGNEIADAITKGLTLQNYDDLL